MIPQPKFSSISLLASRNQRIQTKGECKNSLNYETFSTIPLPITQKDSVAPGSEKACSMVSSTSWEQMQEQEAGRKECCKHKILRKGFLPQYIPNDIPFIFFRESRSGVEYLNRPDWRAGRACQVKGEAQQCLWRPPLQAKINDMLGRWPLLDVEIMS